MTCQRCDDLLDEVGRLREELAELREELAARTWERDHAVASYQRVRDDLRELQLRAYAPKGQAAQ